DDDDDDDTSPSACQGAPAVAEAQLRRLSHREYNNTVRDLLGDETRPADAFPPEEEKYGFNNIAEAQSSSELLVEGYMGAAEALAAAAVLELDALLPCDPQVIGELECGQQFIAAFGRRAFRRALTDEERARMEGVLAWGLAEEGLALGVELVIQAMLQSAHFLYRVELGTPDPDGDGVVRLRDHEIASRLSYLLWNSMPDETLLAAADAGALATGAQIRAQAERMLADPRARDSVLDFHTQALKLAQLPSVARDPETYPDFTDAIRGKLLQETEAFIEHVVFEDDGRLRTLLTAPYTFLDGALASYYALPGAAGPTLEKVALPPASHRAGILTHGSLLAVLGGFQSTAPVQRGVFVRSRLLCTEIPPPPDNIDFQPPDVDPNATTRERFSQHSVDPTCSACHQYMDPVGFGFEHFDGVGRYRAVENGFPVDASGELLDAGDASGEFDGVIALSQRLAESEQVRDCVVEQWYRYAFARPAAVDDACSIEQVREVFSQRDGDIRELLLALTETDAFAYARATPGGGA
ncbi:MAG: DUF1592 domain-containing protein, partial [Myxococcales bacterium]|nr:DUF1592 domain-containing protein [Myxococcales bacterium]